MDFFRILFPVFLNPPCYETAKKKRVKKSIKKKKKKEEVTTFFSSPPWLNANLGLSSFMRKAVMDTSTIRCTSGQGRAA
jgi:hypothetical protein